MSSLNRKSGSQITANNSTTPAADGGFEFVEPRNGFLMPSDFAVAEDLKSLRKQLEPEEYTMRVVAFVEKYPAEKHVPLFRSFGISRMEMKQFYGEIPRLARSGGRGVRNKISNLKPVASYEPAAWRVPYTKAPLIEKPKFYIKRLFRDWVHGVATVLRTELKFRTQFVSGNPACELLYWGSGRIDRDNVMQLLSEAHVFVDSYTSSLRKPNQIQLRDYFPIPVFRVGSMFLWNVLELSQARDTFKNCTWLYDEMYEVLISHTFEGFAGVQRKLDARFPLRKEIATAVAVAPLDLGLGEVEITPRLAPSKVYESVEAPITFKIEREERVMSVKKKEVQVSPELVLSRSSVKGFGHLSYDPNPTTWFKTRKAWFKYRDRQKVEEPRAPRLKVKKSPKVEESWEGCYYENGDCPIPYWRRQGQVASVPQETTANRLSADVIQGALSTIYYRYERVSAQIVALFAALFAAETWTQRAAAAAQFIVGNDAMWARFRELLEKIPDVLHRQGADSPVPPEAQSWFAEFWQAVVGSALVLAINEAAQDVGSYVIQPLLSFVKTFRFSMEKSMSSRLAETIIDAFVECVARVKSCWTQKSFAPLWGPDWDPQVWMKLARGIVTHISLLCVGAVSKPNDADALRQLRETGDIPTWWATPVLPDEYVNRLELHIDAGKRLQKYFSRVPAISNELGRALSVCNNALEQAKVAAYSSNERVCPFFMVMYSKPGTGKTVLEGQIRRALATRFGFDLTPQGTYVWVPAVNFQTGLTHVCWAVKMDDVDHSVAPPMAGAPTHMDSICKLVNNSPFNVEEAAVEVKGKTFANPLYVSYLTNFVDGKVLTNIAAPEAFWRRIDMYVTVSAKESFSKGNGLLDAAKASLSDTHDMYDMTVQYFDAARLDPSNRAAHPLTKAVSVSFPELMVLIIKAFDEKIKRELDLLKVRSTVGPVCPMCYLPTSKSCGHVMTLQGRSMLFSDHHLEEEEEEDERTANPGVCSNRMKNFVDSFKNRIVNQFDMFRTFTWDLAIQNVERALASTFDRNFFAKAALGVAGLAVLASLTKRTLTMQAREMNGTGILPTNWLRAEQKFTPGLPPASAGATYTKEDLIASLGKAHVTVSGPRFSMHGYAIGQNLVLVPTHVLFDVSGKVDPNCKLHINCDSVVVPVQMSPFSFEILPSNEELCVIKVSNMGGRGSISKIVWPCVDTSVAMFDEIEVWTTEKLYTVTSHQFAAAGMSTQIPQPRVLVGVTNVSTKDGDCGAVYVSRFGKSWRVIAMHYALFSSTTLFGTSDKFVAGIVTALELSTVASRLASVYQGIETPQSVLTLSPRYELSRYPIKSEVHVAISHHGAVVFPLGTLSPPLSGSTPKTKITRSLVCDDFADEITGWCGMPFYWKLPNFSGFMQGDKWVSPYTHMFSAQNFKQPIDYYMWLALADYINGIDLLDRDGFTTLSEEQVLSGISGSQVGAINMKTSVGPPHNKAKSHFMDVTAGESYVNEEIWKAYDDLERVLENDDIPAAVGLCTLKDEPLKPGKMPRVFTCMPAAFNFLAKKYMAALTVFVRNNLGFFESAVGINMTSLEANRLVVHLKRVDPSLTLLVDGDAKLMDKALSGFLLDFATLFIYAVGFALGLPAKKIHHLLCSVKHTRYSVKNDLFSIFFNPSGWDWTVGLNGTVMSLGERYAYYRARPKNLLPTEEEVLSWSRTFMENPIVIPFKEKLTFRNDVALVTYGDDNLKAMRSIPDNYEELWADEIGLIMTDASKSGRMRHKTLAEVEFLKRSFVYSEDVKAYVTPLSKKSMARTLAWKKESVLSSPDHASVAMSEVMREAVYHGEPFYKNFRDKCDLVAGKHGLLTNSYYVSKPYDHWLAALKDGSFCAWVPRGLPQLFSTNDNTEYC